MPMPVPIAKIACTSTPMLSTANCIPNAYRHAESGGMLPTRRQSATHPGTTIAVSQEQQAHQRTHALPNH
eukprot:2795191-Rhodomonas_salina.4